MNATADASLADVLIARAREATDGRLVLDVVGGLSLALMFVFWRPAAWLVPFGIGVCLLAFGVWGITDRELGERGDAAVGTPISALRIGRMAAAVIGVVAAVVVVLAGLGAALGTWVS